MVVFRDIELPFTDIDSPYIINHFLRQNNPLGYFQVIHPRAACASHEIERHGRCRRRVLGGLYMMKHIPTLNMTEQIERFEAEEKDMFGADEIFLSEVIHPNYTSIVYYDPVERIKSTVKREEYKWTESYVEMDRSFKDVSLH